jgi:hypothetical protein
MLFHVVISHAPISYFQAAFSSLDSFSHIANFLPCADFLKEECKRGLGTRHLDTQFHSLFTQLSISKPLMTLCTSGSATAPAVSFQYPIFWFAQAVSEFVGYFCNPLRLLADDINSRSKLKRKNREIYLFVTQEHPSDCIVKVICTFY